MLDFPDGYPSGKSSTRPRSVVIRRARGGSAQRVSRPPVVVCKPLSGGVVAVHRRRRMGRASPSPWRAVLTGHSPTPPQVLAVPPLPVGPDRLAHGWRSTGRGRTGRVCPPPSPASCPQLGPCGLSNWQDSPRLCSGGLHGAYRGRSVDCGAVRRRHIGRDPTPAQREGAARKDQDHSTTPSGKLCIGPHFYALEVADQLLADELGVGRRDRLFGAVPVGPVHAHRLVGPPRASRECPHQ